MKDSSPPEQECGWAELPDVIPDWVLEQGPLAEPPSCDCGCTCSATAQPVDDAVAALQASVRRLAVIDPAGLPSAQALADGEALLAVEQQLRVLNLRRVADVGGRGLPELVGFRSTKAWLRAHRPDGDAADAALASQLRDFSEVRAAVDAGRVPLAGARRVVLALRKVAPFVDRPDGRIDGQPGEEVVTAVVRHVVTLLCRSLQGLADDDPRVALLLGRAREVLARGSQLQVLEAAFTWLAAELPARHLTAPLDELVLALLPSTLEDRGERGHRRRGLSLAPLDDGTGWHVCGDLDLECGEQLWAALRAEAARDPRNPQDTAAWSEASAEDKDAWQVGAELAGSAHPRNRRERLHDALQRLLARYLEHGLGGTAGKLPVQVHVTLTEQTVTGAPGAPPPRADSGRLIPRALVRRWWCDSSVTAFVLGLGGKALRVVHSQRTVTGEERRALAVEGGDRCAGDGCCSGLPDALVPIRPHHVLGFAEDRVTSLEDTLPVCSVLHRDLHEGGRTVRLRDGRYLNAHGFVDEPGLTEHPPF